MAKELVNYTGKGFRARYNAGTHSVEMYFGDSLVHIWPVARNDMPMGNGDDMYPQYRIDAFVAQQMGDLFRRIEGCECDAE